MARTIEHLSPARVEELWPDIEYLLHRVVGEDISTPNPTTVDGIRTAVRYGVAHILGIFAGNRLDLIVVFEFTVAGGVKTASISAVAGRRLLLARTEFWGDILAWFKASGARAVDAYAKPRLAKIYHGKFGFTDVCSYVRMAL